MPATTQALVIALLILSPGYVFTQVARRVIAYIEEPTEGRFFLTLLTTGTVIHAIAFPWSIRIYRYYRANTLLDHAWEAFGWALVTILILPLCLGIIVGLLSTVGWIDRLLDKVGFGYLDRLPSAWDYAVDRNRGKYVRVHLKDGKGVIGGLYSLASHGSTNWRRPDLYLETVWLLDESNNFVKPVERSHGVWISHDIMGNVEFLEGEDEPYDQAGEEEPAEGGDVDKEIVGRPGAIQGHGGAEDREQGGAPE